MYTLVDRTFVLFLVRVVGAAYVFCQDLHTLSYPRIPVIRF